MRRSYRPSWLRYLVALVSVFVVMEVRIWLGGHAAGMEGPPFTMMFAGVLVAAWFGGIGPGVFATLVGAGVCDYMFIEPRGTLLGNSFGYDLRLGLFIIEGLVVSWVIQALKSSSAATRQVERNLRLIARNTSDVIFAYDMSRQLLYVNDAFETLTGNSINELRENPFMNYIHPDDSQRMRTLFDGLFTGKSFRDVEYRIITHDGQVKWCRATWGPLLDERSEQIGVQGRETEITEQKRSEGALEFLAETCSIVAEGRAAEATLARVARAAVAQFADWCLVDLVEEGGGWRTVAAAHADSSREPWIAELQREYPPSPDATEGRAKVLRTGQPEIVPVISEERITTGARDARHLKLIRNLTPRSSICVPLRSGDRVLGAMTFVSSRPGRRYEAGDLIFASDLGRRVGEAVGAKEGAGFRV
jgi:PAS domain S-box-containing protein